MCSATDRVSARFMKPVRGLKYPAPSMAALAAAADVSSREGMDAAAPVSRSASAASPTSSGFRVSDPYGLIMLYSFHASDGAQRPGRHGPAVNFEIVCSPRRK